MENIDQNRNIIQNICKLLQLSNDDLMQIKQLFLKDIKMGLRKESDQFDNVVNCYLTYVQNLPTGCEKGIAVALDLSSTTFNITVMSFKGQMNYKFNENKYEIPVKLLYGTSQQLFDYVAESLWDFLKKYSLHMEEVALAFIFGFRIIQRGLHEGELVAWSKNFNIRDAVGCDVVALLRKSLERRTAMKISTIVLVNDTTAVLMSCAFKNSLCKIGVVVDSGSNACYVEQVKKIEKFTDTKTVPPLTHMVINTEWACFGDNDSLDFIKTCWDDQVNELLPTAERRTFEKMTSGLYLGPLAREVILDAIRTGALFNGIISPVLKKANSFKTSFVLDIESQNIGEHSVTRDIFHKLGYQNPSDEDCANVRYICEMVCQRSAHLIAATVSCLVERVADSFVAVGIDGYMFRCHPSYQKCFWQKVRALVKPDHKIELIISEAGTACGAALLAIADVKHQKIMKKRKPKLLVRNASAMKMKGFKPMMKLKRPNMSKVKCYCKNIRN